MARGLAVLLLVVVAAVAPFAYAGPETVLTAPAVAATTQAAGAITPGLPLYQETGNPTKDAAGAAGAIPAGGIQPGLPLYQDIGSGPKV